MIQVLMPMAGDGLRFKKDFPNTPKPLIEIKGRFLYEYAIESISTLPEIKLFMALQEKVAKNFSSKFPHEAKVITVKEKTTGALETCLKAKEFLDPEKKLLVLDSDLSFRCPLFLEFMKNSNNEHGFPTFTSTEPRFSYAESENGLVKKTREKEVISNMAIVGAYFFSSAQKFIDAAESIISSGKKQKGEFYISPVYNELIRQGDIVKSFQINKYYSLGTPEEVEKFISLNS